MKYKSGFWLSFMQGWKPLGHSWNCINCTNYANQLEKYASFSDMGALTEGVDMTQCEEGLILRGQPFKPLQR